MEIPLPLDIDAIKQEAADDLLADAVDFLDRQTANSRLQSLRNAQVLKPEELANAVEKATGLHLPQDQVGGIIIPDGPDMLGKRVLLEETDSGVEAYHTAVHEGIHLLGPDSVASNDIIRGRVVSRSLGPMSTVWHLDKEGKVIYTTAINEDEKLFWEAATDLVAAEKTATKFGQEETDILVTEKGLGFIQRYWLKYLTNQHPNPSELLSAMKKALYQGDILDFYRILGGRLDGPYVPFYHTLVGIMQEGENALKNGDGQAYSIAFDKWTQVITGHFNNGGAYSLDITNF